MNIQQKFTQVVLVLVTIILLVAFATCKADELYNYKVAGQNKNTGLVVVGRVWEIDKQGNLKAKIYDELTIQDQCFGAWVGHGVAQVGCENGYQYVVRVTEE